MNYLNAIKNLVIGDDSEQKIANIIPVSNEEFACSSSDCHNKFNESCFEIKGDDAVAPLYETAKPPNLHFFVSTGKTDWEHDAFEEAQTILGLFNSKSTELADNCKIKVKCNTTNDAININDKDAITLNKLKVLILPWFVWIDGITNENIDSIFKVIEEIVNDKNDEIKGKQADVLISKLNSVKDIKITKDLNSSYVLLCSHRTRDKKCGITAPIMKKEFDSQLRDLELYRDASDDRPDGVKVMFTNHVGGHKFAANVLVYNKHGEFVWFARCSPLNIKFIINETVLNHKVYPKNVRACSKFDSIKW